MSGNDPLDAAMYEKFLNVKSDISMRARPSFNLWLEMENSGEETLGKRIERKYAKFRQLGCERLCKGELRRLAE